MAAASLVPATAKLDKDAFFEGLKAAVAACSSAGSVRVTFKSVVTAAEAGTLVRAATPHTKLSTIVSSAAMASFSEELHGILSAAGPQA